VLKNTIKLYWDARGMINFTTICHRNKKKKKKNNNNIIHIIVYIF
jgi:hypothetical protein